MLPPLLPRSSPGCGAAGSGWWSPASSACPPSLGLAVVLSAVCGCNPPTPSGWFLCSTWSPCATNHKPRLINAHEQTCASHSQSEPALPGCFKVKAPLLSSDILYICVCRLHVQSLIRDQSGHKPEKRFCGHVFMNEVTWRLLTGRWTWGWDLRALWSGRWCWTSSSSQLKHSHTDSGWSLRSKTAAPSRQWCKKTTMNADSRKKEDVEIKYKTMRITTTNTTNCKVQQLFQWFCSKTEHLKSHISFSFPQGAAI